MNMMFGDLIPPTGGAKFDLITVAPKYNFSSPHQFLLFSAPLFLFSAPLIVVTLLPRNQSYSVDSLAILNCNHRLWVAIHVSRRPTSAWRLRGSMKRPPYFKAFCVLWRKIDILMQVCVTAR